MSATTTDPAPGGEQHPAAERPLSSREVIGQQERWLAALAWLGGVLLNVLAPLVVWLVVRRGGKAPHATAHAGRATAVFAGITAAVVALLVISRFSLAAGTTLVTVICYLLVFCGVLLLVTTVVANTARALRAEETAPLIGGVTHVVLIIWSLVTAVPILWVLASSLKTDTEIFLESYRLPRALMWDNYARAWSVSNFSQYFFNSLVIVGCSVVLVMLLGSMVAYCLARYQFRGRRLLTMVIIAANAVPILVAMVPLYGVMRSMSLLNTYHGLIAVYTAFAMPFTVFFLMSFFQSLPRETFEAAFVDGAGHFRTFFLVMLPMARPGLISIGIFNALGLWNQYIIPLFVNNDDPAMYVVPQGLAKMAAEAGYASDYSGLFAGLVIGMAPVLILYLFFQRQIQEGMTAGALK